MRISFVLIERKKIFRFFWVLEIFVRFKFIFSFHRTKFVKRKEKSNWKLLETWNVSLLNKLCRWYEINSLTDVYWYKWCGFYKEMNAALVFRNQSISVCTLPIILCMSQSPHTHTNRNKKTHSSSFTLTFTYSVDMHSSIRVSFAELLL